MAFPRGDLETQPEGTLRNKSALKSSHVLNNSEKRKKKKKERGKKTQHPGIVHKLTSEGFLLKPPCAISTESSSKMLTDKTQSQETCCGLPESDRYTPRHQKMSGFLRMCVCVCGGKVRAISATFAFLPKTQLCLCVGMHIGGGGKKSFGSSQDFSAVALSPRTFRPNQEIPL